MNDLLLSLFGLCATNNGEFKSEKQAKFFASKGEGQKGDWEIYRVETFSFGEHNGCRRQIGYTAQFDTVGVTKIVKDDAKGKHVMYERGGINTYAANRDAKAERFARAQQEVLANDIPARLAEIAALNERIATNNRDVLCDAVKAVLPVESWEFLVGSIARDNAKLEEQIQQANDSIAYLKKEFKL